MASMTSTSRKHFASASCCFSRSPKGVAAIPDDYILSLKEWLRHGSATIFTCFFSRRGVIAGATALAVFVLYREPEKFDLLKVGAAVTRAVSFCENAPFNSDAERLNCLQNFQKLWQFADALAEELLLGTFDTCASSETAGNVDRVWTCLSMKHGAMAAENYKRPF